MKIQNIMKNIHHTTENTIKNEQKKEYVDTLELFLYWNTWNYLSLLGIFQIEK